MSVEVKCDDCGRKPTNGFACESCCAKREEKAKQRGYEEGTDEPMDCAECGSSVDVHSLCQGCEMHVKGSDVRDYADRRKMLGLMSPEVFAAFELCAEDLEARHG